jgi:hypothetical protein
VYTAKPRSALRLRGLQTGPCSPPNPKHRRDEADPECVDQLIVTFVIRSSATTAGGRDAAA